MPDLKISQLPDGTPAQGSDEIPVQRGLGNARITVDDILALSPSVIPGRDGEDGEDAPVIPGPQGIQGPAGSDGVIGRDGLSIPGRDGEDGEDAPIIPGPAGAAGTPGTNGTTTFILRQEDGEDGRDSFVPGPQGIQGPAGSGAGSDPSYSPGSFTVSTETEKFLCNRLKLATTQRITLNGTGRLALLN